MSENKVTSIEELVQYSKGKIVRLPDFGEGQPFYARLRRPSLMAMVKSGKIPNELIVTANELFVNRATTAVKAQDENMMKNIFDVFDQICAATFVEPSYADLKQAGVELTDDQYMFIFTYSQQGVKALEPFRTESAN